MNEEVKKIGKIRYIEPNDFLNKNKNDNIIQAYEDFSLSVDLIVKVPNRSNVKNNDNTEKILGKNTYSFFTGTDGYFTDAPGTITYLDLMNGNTKGVNESLGITNIYIKYSSYYYPEVTINFTDVRGTALMGPQEENYSRYYRNLSKKNNEDNTEKYEEYIESFFSSLFSFPSPEFILRVKGFYGKKIEYNLMISQFKSSFNQNTGNFDVTIDFIGKMYGMYTDIPMTYILMAPYSKYKNSGKTIWEEKQFKIGDTPMPTFIKLKEDLIKNKSELTIESKPEILKRYISNQDSIRYLTDIKININKLKDQTIKIGKIGHIGNNQSNIDFGIISNKRNNEYEYENNTFFKIWGNIFFKIYELLNEYNKTTINKKIDFFPGFKYADISYIYQDNDFYVTLEDNKLNLSAGLKKYLDENINNEDVTSFQENIKRICEDERNENIKNGVYTEYNDEKFYIIHFKKIIDDIDRVINKNNEEIKEVVDKISNIMEESITDYLGFKPSIRNIFKILMAHIECFVDIFSSLIDNINIEHRTFNNFNLTNDNFPDLPIFDNNDIIPPFPLFKETNDNSVCYPTKLGYYTKECEFIDSFFETIKSYKDLILLLNNLEIKQSLELLPSCVSDYYLYNNPYKNIFNSNFLNDGIHINYIFTFFGIRLINALYYGQMIYDPLIFNNYGFIEAYNFWIVNKGIHKDIIEKIKNSDFNFENFIKYLSYEKNPYLNNEGLTCYNLPNNPNKPMISENDNLYKVEEHYKTFLLDSSQENALDFFLKRCEKKYDNHYRVQSYNITPVNYVKSISSNILDSWQTRIDSADFDKLSDKLKKEELNNIINKFKKIDPTIIHSNNTVYISSVFYESKGKYDNENFLTDIELKFDLQHLYNDYGNKNEYDLTSIIGGGVPLFLNNDLTPEEFLLNLPWDSNVLNDNFKIIGEEVGYGQYVMLNIPYFVKLYLGMIISFIKKFAEENVLPWFFQEKAIRHSDVISRHQDEGTSSDKNGYMRIRELFTQFKHVYFSSKYEIGKIFNKECNWIYYMHGDSLDKILDVIKKILYATSDGYMHYFNSINTTLYKYDKKWNEHGISDSHEPSEAFDNWLKLIDFMESVRNRVKDKKNLNITDYLGCYDEFKKWSESNAEGGFLYFKQEYCLKEKNPIIENGKQIWESKIKDENGEPYRLSFDYITTFDKLQSLVDIDKSNKSFTTNGALKSILDNTFKSEAYPSEEDAFSKRYKYIYIGKSLPKNLYNYGYYYTGNKYQEHEVPYARMGEWYQGETYNYANYYSFPFGDLKTMGDWHNYDCDNGEFQPIMQFMNTNIFCYTVFNPKFRAYNALNEFFHKNEVLIMPLVENEGVMFKKNDVQRYFNDFKKGLHLLYQIDEKSIDKNELFVSTTVSEEQKLSMYKTFKNLYDKHFTFLPTEKNKYNLNDDNNNDCEFKRIHYIDTFYNDIGDTLIFNNDKLIEILDKITTNSINNDISVYSFMSFLCEKHNMLLLAVPIFNGNFSTSEGVENFQKMFTPIPFEDAVGENHMAGPSYICFYPHQSSQYLDIPNCQYKNDGFNIEDINDMDNFDSAIKIPDLIDNGENKYFIPAFSVEYGSQKQSIFKSINVNMDNPQVTEASVALQFGLISDKNTSPKNISFEGQDLFKIYSNYSYTCQVEMMGCAQIQPLMYFQLNNIPMFRGAYQIINVEHNIVPGDMTTKFKGVRINRTKMPLVKTGININNLNNVISNLDQITLNNDNGVYFESLLFGNINNITNNCNLIKNWDGGNNIDYNTFTGMCKNINIDKNSIDSYTPEIKGENVKESFNKLYPDMKSLFYGIANRLNEENIIMRVTSMTRNNKTNTSSDHNINVDFPNEKRKNVETSKKENGIMKKFKATEYGCAIDMVQCKYYSKVVDISVFHCIALEFTPYINKLIWENKNTSNDVVENCIHLSSYGLNNGCKEIFFGYYVNGVVNSVKANNLEYDDEKYSNTPPTNLPIMFIKTLLDLSFNNEVYDTVVLNNFINGNINKKPTNNQLQKWYNELTKER